MNKLPEKLSVLAQLCDGEVVGSGDRLIESICSIDDQQANGLVFIETASAAKKLSAREEVIYIVKPEQRSLIQNGIVHEQPQQAFRRILVALTKTTEQAQIHPTAVIHPSAQLGRDVSIGANSIIEAGVEVGDNCRIGCGSVIEASSVLDNDTCIGHRVVIHHKTMIGKCCVISEGAVIGGQGFGFSFEGGHWQAIPQIGRVLIGNYVHIGANTCIDRGAINDTIIGNNVIIDNLVHIAHNVEVDDGTAMAAGVGIAGSTKVGKYCLLAGQVGVVGHIQIADQVQVNGGARVLKSIPESGVYAGSFHVQPAKQWNRLSVYMKRLHSLFKRENTNEQ